MRPSTVLTALVGLLIFAGTGIGTAQATSIITGNLWHVDEATSQNAIPANVPGTTPDVTFQVNSPTMNFNGANLTVGDWLATGSAFNIIENAGGTLASLMDSGTTGTLVNFTGFVTVTSPHPFTVTHDDGLSLLIADVSQISSPGPTSPTVTNFTYTGAPGTFPFQLVYGECCQGPAVLQIDLPFSDAPSVPEPASLLLLGAGLAGIGIWKRKSTK